MRLSAKSNTVQFKPSGGSKGPSSATCRGCIAFREEILHEEILREQKAKIARKAFAFEQK